MKNRILNNILNIILNSKSTNQFPTELYHNLTEEQKDEVLKRKDDPYENIEELRKKLNG